MVAELALHMPLQSWPTPDSQLREGQWTNRDVQKNKREIFKCKCQIIEPIDLCIYACVSFNGSKMLSDVTIYKV